jgi:hypothetical protein
MHRQVPGSAAVVPPRKPFVLRDYEAVVQRARQVTRLVAAMPVTLDTVTASTPFVERLLPLACPDELSQPLPVPRRHPRQSIRMLRNKLFSHEQR